MAYAPTNWADNVTLLDEAHLDNIEQGIVALDVAMAGKADLAAMTTADALKVDKDSVVALASRIVSNKLNAADTQSVMRILGNGRIEWGVGGSTAPDTFLQRSNLGTLSTGGTFDAATLTVPQVIISPSQIAFADYAARVVGANGGILKLYDHVQVMGDLAIQGVDVASKLDSKVDEDSVTASATRLLANKYLLTDAQPAFRVRGDGSHSWGPGGALALDTTLRRSGVGELRTDGTLDANQLTINGVPVGTGGGGITSITTTTPTNLTGLLKGNATDIDVAVADTDYATPGAVTTASGLKVDKDAVTVAATRLVQNKLLVGDAQPSFRIMGDGKIEWGGGSSVPDFNLARTSATTLKHSATFHVADSLVARQGGAGQVTVGTSSSTPTVSWGSGTDATIIRQSSGILRTAGTFDANALTINGVPVGGGAALPADTVVVAATRIIANKLLAGDTQPAWRQMGDGRLEWGGGGTTALDTNLYRMFGGRLKTDGRFDAGQQLLANAGHASAEVMVGFGGGTTAPSILFGTTGDTNLYRSAANTLKTDGWLGVGGAIMVDQSGAGNGLYFGSAQDTSLYRDTPDGGLSLLKTDGHFWAGGSLIAARGGANQVRLGYTIPGIHFGSANDTNLYRSAANQLKTDDDFVTADGADIFVRSGGASQVNIGGRGPGGQAGITFGVGAGDTNLYRSAANTLKTDKYFYAGDNILAQAGAAQQVQIGYGPGGTAAVQFGSASDTNLYRSAANTLKTDGWLGVGGAIMVDQSGAGNGLYFGSAQDTSLYRDTPDGGLSLLKTDGHFWAGGSLIAARGGANQVRLGYTIPGIHFGSANDTNLYRSAANQLKTDDDFVTADGADIFVRSGGASQVNIGGRGPGGQAGITFGVGAGDTNLYRSAANTLKTDKYFYAGDNILAQAGAAQQVQIGYGPGGTAAVQFGSASDTNLYRAAADTLKTDDTFMAVGNVYANQGNSVMVNIGYDFISGLAGISFGNPLDTSLYRAAAGVLKTNGVLSTVGGLQLNPPGNTFVIDGVPLGALGAFQGSIRIYVNGVAHKIPYYA